MWRFLLVAALIAMIAPSAHANGLPSPSDQDPGTITISCYRGPTKTVAWDRANAVFLDDLRQLGYNQVQAASIGERVCRDEYGVDNPAHLRATLLRILRDTPPRP